MEEREQYKERYNGLLEEYKSLREEIMKRQDARLYIAGFTMAAIGTILGLTLGKGASVGSESDYCFVALVGFALVILNASLILTIQHSQQINNISAYIKGHSEEEMPGMKWESTWASHRKLEREKSKFFGFPWRTHRALALFYFFLTVAVYSIIFVIGLDPSPALILVSILAIFSLVSSCDLYAEKTAGWKVKNNIYQHIDKNKNT